MRKIEYQQKTDSGIVQQIHSCMVQFLVNDMTTERLWDGVQFNLNGNIKISSQYIYSDAVQCYTDQENIISGQKEREVFYK